MLQHPPLGLVLLWSPFLLLLVACLRLRCR